MAWKWLDALLGRSAGRQSQPSTDTAGSGTLSEDAARRLEQLQASLKHLRQGKSDLDKHTGAETQFKQALSTKASVDLGKSGEQMPQFIRSLLDEAIAHQHVAALEKQLAEAKAKAEQLKAGNQLGEHRDEMMQLADKLATSRERADFAWLMMQLRISNGRMELGFARRALSAADLSRPEIAPVVAEIEALLGPEQSGFALIMRPNRA